MIALIVPRHAHHRTGAVIHHHVVADPDGQFLTAEGIDRLQAGVYAVLFDHFIAFGRFLALDNDLIDLLEHIGRKDLAILFNDLVLRRDDNGIRTVDRVDAGRKDTYLLVIVTNLEINIRAVRTAYPILLAFEHVLRPA